MVAACNCGHSGIIASMCVHKLINDGGADFGRGQSTEKNGKMGKAKV